jgi:HK97 family phage major capsid protein
MLKNRKAVLEKRGDLVKRCNEIVDKADLEKRSLVDSERHEFEGISVELASIDSELYKDDTDRIIRRNSGNHINVTREERNGFGEEPLRQNSGEKRFSYALGQTMRQMVGLDPHIEKRAIVSAGSALIQNPNIVDEIIFSLQSRNPLVDAGVQFVNIDNNKQMPRVTAYPTANWVNEAGTVGASDTTIDGLKWELKDVAVLVKVKNNVLYDAAIDVQRLITEVAERAINDAILKAMFYGATGSNQPKGIDNFAGALVVDMGTDGAALQNYNPFISATRKLMDVNIDKNNISFIYNPSIAETIAGFVDTTSQPLNAPKMIEALRSFETTAVKSDYTAGETTDTTRVYAGDFSKMIVGLGGSFSITLDQSYAAELTTGFLIHARLDMKPLFENAFCIIEGITTS